MAVALLCLVSWMDWVGRLRMVLQNVVLAWFGATSDDGSLASWLLPKVPHFLLFGLLGWMAGREEMPRLRSWLLAAALAVGAISELQQAFTVTRNLTAQDLTINLISVVVAYVIARCRTGRRTADNP